MHTLKWISFPGKQSNPVFRQDILRFTESRTVFWSNPWSCPKITFQTLWYVSYPRATEDIQFSQSVVHCAYIVVEGLLFLWYFVVLRSFSISSLALIYRPRILCFFCISMSTATLYLRQSLQQEVAALLENLWVYLPQTSIFFSQLKIVPIVQIE